MRALAVVAERLHAAGLWRRLAELPDAHCIGRASGRNFLGEEILDRLLSVVSYGVGGGKAPQNIPIPEPKFGQRLMAESCHS